VLRRRYPLKKSLKLEDLEGVRTLGEGGFGAVCMARVRNPKSDGKGTVVALKIQQKKTLVLTHHRRNILAERKFLSNMTWSPFVAGILDVFQDTKNAYYVLEFMGLNTLHSERLRRDDVRFTEIEGQFYFSNIVLGLEHLHKHGIAHCDLKPNNILLGDDGYLAITDLGLAKEVSWNSAWDSFGSLEYMPPETFDSEKFGTPSTTLDWWSAGCIVYEIISGERAFADLFGRKKTLQRRIINREIGANGIHQDASIGFYELLDGLIVPDSRIRMGAAGTEEIRMSRWMQDISWADIEARAVTPPNVPAALSFSSSNRPHYTTMLKQEFVPGLSLKEPATALKFIGRDMPSP